MNHDMKFGDRRSLEAQVNSLIDTMGPEEIAEAVGVSINTVQEIIGNRRGRWRLECLKTGRFWMKATERGCYLQAQMSGLVDYTFGRV